MFTFDSGVHCVSVDRNVPLLEFPVLFGRLRFFCSTEALLVYDFSMSIDPQEIQLSDEQREFLASHAEQTGRPWDVVLGEALARIRRKNGSGQGVVGLFSDEPDLVDQVVDSAMLSRESHQLRHPES